MTARNHQIGGDHYASKAVQPWDAMEAWGRPHEYEGFLRFNVVKYLARYPEKGGLQDLYKARHYLAQLIETLEAGDDAG
jgi:hypothetical protein